MAEYGTLRTMKALPIGSVQPWTGNLTRIPKGWLLCNGRILEARQFPLLARILRNTYGGDLISGTFPNYSGSFKLPELNQKGLADISLDYFSLSSEAHPVLLDDYDTDLLPNMMDTAVARSIMEDYIGDVGDIGTIAAINSTVDLIFTYEPDPDGVINRFSYTGTAPAITTSLIRRNISATLTTSGFGQGAIFDVVVNTNGTYSLKIVKKGEDYVVGNQLKISASQLNIPGATTANDITITVQIVGDGLFTGRVEGQRLIPGFGLKPVYVVNRKLSREHLPQHYHGGSYDTINKSDVGVNPGVGVGIFENPSITVLEYWVYCGPDNNPIGENGCQVGGVSHNSTATVWANSKPNGQVNVPGGFFSPFTYGRFALATIQGTPAPQPHSPEFCITANAHGVGRDWFIRGTGVAGTQFELRNFNNATSLDNGPLQLLRDTGKLNVGSTIPFSDNGNPISAPNYDPGGSNAGDSESPIGAINTTRPVLMNNAALNYNQTTETNPIAKQVIDPHNHNGEFTIEYDGEGIEIRPYIDVSVRANITPESINNAFNIEFITPTASLSVVHLIRAY